MDSRLHHEPGRGVRVRALDRPTGGCGLLRRATGIDADSSLSARRASARRETRDNRDQEISLARSRNMARAGKHSYQRIWETGRRIAEAAAEQPKHLHGVLREHMRIHQP